MKDIKIVIDDYYKKLSEINKELNNIEKQINAVESNYYICKAIQDKILNDCTLAFSELDNQKQLVQSFLEELYLIKGDDNIDGGSNKSK